jgi:hypothetical protein
MCICCNVGNEMNTRIGANCSDFTVACIEVKKII